MLFGVVVTAAAALLLPHAFAAPGANVNATAPKFFISGVDVSALQGNVDWSAVVDSGNAFAM